MEDEATSLAQEISGSNTQSNVDDNDKVSHRGRTEGNPKSDGLTANRAPEFTQRTSSPYAISEDLPSTDSKRLAKGHEDGQDASRDSKDGQASSNPRKFLDRTERTPKLTVTPPTHFTSGDGGVIANDDILFSTSDSSDAFSDSGEDIFTPETGKQSHGVRIKNQHPLETPTKFTRTFTPTTSPCSHSWEPASHYSNRYIPSRGHRYSQSCNGSPRHEPFEASSSKCGRYRKHRNSVGEPYESYRLPSSSSVYYQDSQGFSNPNVRVRESSLRSGFKRKSGSESPGSFENYSSRAHEPQKQHRKDKKSHKHHRRSSADKAFLESSPAKERLGVGESSSQPTSRRWSRSNSPLPTMSMTVGDVSDDKTGHYGPDPDSGSRHKRAKLRASCHTSQRSGDPYIILETPSGDKIEINFYISSTDTQRS